MGGSFALGRRHDVLSKAELESPTAIVHLLEREKRRVPQEAIYMNVNKHLRATAASEFLFTCEFFGTASPDVFLHVMKPTLDYCRDRLQSQLSRSHDSLALLMMIVVGEEMRLALQKRNLPCLEDYFEASRAAIWSRFKLLAAALLSGLRKAIHGSAKDFAAAAAAASMTMGGGGGAGGGGGGAAGAGALPSLGVSGNPTDLHPHVSSRRYAELASSLAWLQRRFELVGKEEGNEGAGKTEGCSWEGESPMKGRRKESELEQAEEARGALSENPVGSVSESLEITRYSKDIKSFLVDLRETIDSLMWRLAIQRGNSSDSGGVLGGAVGSLLKRRKGSSDAHGDTSLGPRETMDARDFGTLEKAPTIFLINNYDRIITIYRERIANATSSSSAPSSSSPVGSNRKAHKEKDRSARGKGANNPFEADVAKADEAKEAVMMPERVCGRAHISFLSSLSLSFHAFLSLSLSLSPSPCISLLRCFYVHSFLVSLLLSLSLLLWFACLPFTTPTPLSDPNWKLRLSPKKISRRRRPTSRFSKIASAIPSHGSWISSSKKTMGALFLLWIGFRATYSFRISLLLRLLVVAERGGKAGIRTRGRLQEWRTVRRLIGRPLWMLCGRQRYVCFVWAVTD